MVRAYKKETISPNFVPVEISNSRTKKKPTPLCEHVREPVVVVEPQLAALGEHEQREEGLVPRHPEVEDDRVLLREGPPGGQEEAPAERGRQLPGHMEKGWRSLYREKAY